jgi:hypothetical protein
MCNMYTVFRNEVAEALKKDKSFKHLYRLLSEADSKYNNYPLENLSIEEWSNSFGSNGAKIVIRIKEHTERYDPPKDLIETDLQSSVFYDKTVREAIERINEHVGEMLLENHRILKVLTFLLSKVTEVDKK